MEAASTLRDYSLIVQTVGPMGVLVFVWWQGYRENQRWRERIETEMHRWQQRHQEVVRMYENNVELLKTTQRIAQNSEELIVHNVQVMQKVYDLAKNNMFCPKVREATKG